MTTYPIDTTHEPDLRSWVESANDPASDYPIQNLPWCCFLPPTIDPDDGTSPIHIGVAIGDKVLSLSKAHVLGLTRRWEDAHGVDGWSALNLIDLSGLASISPEARRELRRLISGWLRVGSEAKNDVQQCLFEFSSVELQPYLARVGDYTDFYASVFHATNVGSMFRPDNALLPNYKHVPIGYHGRASSIVPTGTPIRRPVGQKSPAEDGGSPGFGPSSMFDYEMEMGCVIAAGNELGERITIDDAEAHVLGLCLVNDWSARDLQKWEYQPLGPFLAKNFATTVGPVVVSMDALAPFRVPAFERPAGDPSPLPYLTSRTDIAAGGFDVRCEVFLASKAMREQGIKPHRLSSGRLRDMYWTFSQMIAHHTVNGCNLQPGDLLASGTISGPKRESRGCLLELTWDGDPFANPPIKAPGTQRTPIKLPTGEERRFLEDGDEVIMTAYCEREGFRRIGFGECRGIVSPASAM